MPIDFSNFRQSIQQGVSNAGISVRTAGKEAAKGIGEMVKNLMPSNEKKVAAELKQQEFTSKSSVASFAELCLNNIGSKGFENVTVKSVIKDLDDGKVFSLTRQEVGGNKDFAQRLGSIANKLAENTLLEVHDTGTYTKIQSFVFEFGSKEAQDTLGKK